MTPRRSSATAPSSAVVSVDQLRERLQRLSDGLTVLYGRRRELSLAVLTGVPDAADRLNKVEAELRAIVDEMNLLIDAIPTLERQTADVRAAERSRLIGRLEARLAQVVAAKAEASRHAGAAYTAAFEAECAEAAAASEGASLCSALQVLTGSPTYATQQAVFLRNRGRTVSVNTDSLPHVSRVRARVHELHVGEFDWKPIVEAVKALDSTASPTAAA